MNKYKINLKRIPIVSSILFPLLFLSACSNEKWGHSSNNAFANVPTEQQTSPKTADLNGPSNNTSAQATTGRIYYHFFVPKNSPDALDEYLELKGDKYTDLIISNYVAGVMLGHLINQAFPDVKFNKDYLYGSLLAQLLQENLRTDLYDPNLNLISPHPDQQAVMGPGQGGPYQINNYAANMTGEGDFALINYAAVQKNIGFKIKDAPTQPGKQTPSSFNNKYYGPMLTAYFHINDLLSIEYVQTRPWGGGPVPSYLDCLKQFKTIENNFLDIIMNVAYNQGFYGDLTEKYSKICKTADATLIGKINNYSYLKEQAHWDENSYIQYPYQVRFYLDQVYNRATLVPQMKNHVVFTAATLETVFSRAFQTLAYVNDFGQYVFISSDDANRAFETALNSVGLNKDSILDLSESEKRNVTFKIIEAAIQQLEINLKIDFLARTSGQLD